MGISALKIGIFCWLFGMVHNVDTQGLAISDNITAIFLTIVFSGDTMGCYARWKKYDFGLCFRDQIVLQLGDSWKLIANFILLNPGIALPEDKTSQKE